MTRKLLLLLAITACGATTDAIAATITATAKGNTVTVFSTSDKSERCTARINFTYLQDGKRTPGFTSKESFVTVPGENVKVWDFTNPALIDPIISGGIDAHCGDDMAKKK
ncbi:MAG: hypothetical protein EPO08_15120 [Rhodospirillaceae bacterium]|nr:MAG: hypothetical protein EPO08_15120 [Rhodospirillaceae bacterium]